MGRPGESPATQFWQMASVSAMCWALSSIIQLVLAISFTGPRGQFFTVPASSQNVMCAAWALGSLGGPVESPATQFLPNAVRCRVVLDASVDDPAAFGVKAHSFPRPILRCARMLPWPAAKEPRGYPATQFDQMLSSSQKRYALLSMNPLVYELIAHNPTL